MAAGLQIWDSKGQMIYNSDRHKSYYKLGEFAVSPQIYPTGTSEGYGNIEIVFSNKDVKIDNTYIVKKEDVIAIGYSAGHYPAHGQDGHGYVDIVINDGYITAQFKRYPASGTGGAYYVFSVGTYEVWGIKK